jgi:hypothetical protein
MAAFLPVLIWVILFAPLTGWLASTKGRSAVSWAILGAIFGFIALIAVGFAPAPAASSSMDPFERASARTCPFCAEPIRRTATVCRFCRRSVPALPDDPVPHPCWCNRVIGEHDIRDHP